MKILAFDTSAAHVAAALLCDGRILSEIVEPMARGQAERLMGLLQEALAAQSLAWRDLDAIAVGTGPGNFTGIRISVAAARGLSLSTGRPAVGIGRLEALAWGGQRPLVATADARRGGVHWQVFGDGPSAPVLSDLAELPAPGMPRGLPCLGEMAAAVAAATGGQVAAPAASLPAAMANLAAERMPWRGPRPSPAYGRPADAALPRAAPR